MSTQSFTGADIIRIGYKQGSIVGMALRAANSAANSGISPEAIESTLTQILADPSPFTSDAHFGGLAEILVQQNAEPAPGPEPRAEPAPFKIWGSHDEGTLRQLQAASRLPCAVRSALMPDGHIGYGLPIGGVLALENAVCPYAVGVDIACRMKLSIFDLPAAILEGDRAPFVNALQKGTVFGVGGVSSTRAEHEVLDADWGVTAITRGVKDKAAAQLGTSGSGNHFVEFGLLRLDQPDLGLKAGVYLALLSHSGSRGSGAAVCDHYSKIAASRLPASYLADADLRKLGWLDMDTSEGHEYWAAMNLMGQYAAANHAVIHRRVAALIGASAIAGVENHHNFAWREEHDGKPLYVHRKGATPAGKGVLGVIPGSMADPGFVVRGRGGAGSLDSAAHGAGRQMSRKAANEKFTRAQWKPKLNDGGVTLISAGLDEMPGAYKNIHEVMAAMSDLVEVVGRFDPKIVKMSDDGTNED
jgi:tRNA-splicing ligase RtcB (3'-phosphate/5'-hydroxy nucleic acid ligase)